MMKFELWKSKGQWYWHLKARNGLIICQSEGYTRRFNAVKTIRAIKYGAEWAVIHDLDA